MLICFSTVPIIPERQLRTTSGEGRVFPTGSPQRDQGDSEEVRNNNARQQARLQRATVGKNYSTLLLQTAPEINILKCQQSLLKTTQVV